MVQSAASEPKIYCRSPFYKGLAKVLMSFLHHKLDFEFVGLENLPKSGSYIMVANHETIADGLLIACALNKQQFANFHCLAGADLAYNYGILGIIALHIGQTVPIDRNGNPIKGMNTAKDLLKQQDKILLVFPEGTRSYDGNLGSFHGGASLLVKNTQLPLVPVFIDGAYEFFNRYYKLPRFKDADGKRLKIRLVFGKPIDTANCKRTKEITSLISDWFLNSFANKKVPRDFANLPRGTTPSK